MPQVNHIIVGFAAASCVAALLVFLSGMKFMPKRVANIASSALGWGGAAALVFSLSGFSTSACLAWHFIITAAVGLTVMRGERNRT